MATDMSGGRQPRSHSTVAVIPTVIARQSVAVPPCTTVPYIRNAMAIIKKTIATVTQISPLAELSLSIALVLPWRMRDVAYPDRRTLHMVHMLPAPPARRSARSVTRNRVRTPGFGISQTGGRSLFPRHTARLPPPENNRQLGEVLRALYVLARATKCPRKGKTRCLSGRFPSDGITVQVSEPISARKGDSLRPLARMAARWVQDNHLSLENADPSVPEALHDRAQDNARALCAIADRAGGDWPLLLRTALVGAATAEAEEEPQSAGILLLTDIQGILARWKGSTIGSSDLLRELLVDEEGPWAEWRRGNPITARGIAKHLKPFGIAPTKDRQGRFYQVADFRDAFTRYLKSPPE